MIASLDRPSIRAAAAVVAGLALTACGGGEKEAGEAPAGEAGAEAEASGPVVPPDSQAVLQGVVNFEGSPPSPEAIDMAKEPTCAEAYAPEGPETRHVVVNDGKLANVFVYVKSGLQREFPTPRNSVVLDQRDCRYHPHVFGLQAGQDLVIRNSDGILHNINAQPQENRGFNKSQPGAIEELPPVQFSTPEVMIPVKCDVHGWMNAYIGVQDHPYHASSAEDGTFSIAELPPGEYVLEAWHERYGTMTDTVTVAAKDTAQISFTYSDDMAGADVPLGDPLVVSHDGARRVPRSR